MIVREREPVVYTSTSEDWSAASVILAIAVVALLGFLVYYFSIMHAATVINMPQQSPIIQHDVTPMPVPTPVPVTQPVPYPVVTPLPTPVPVPQVNSGSTSGSTSSPAPSTTTAPSTTDTTTSF